MKTISGQVTDITPQSGVSKRTGKPYTIWTAVVDGTPVKMGFNKPGFNAGDTVTLDVQQNKYGDWEPIAPGKPSGGRAPAAPSGPAPAPAGRTFPVATTSPEMSIIRQNALTNANAAVGNYFEHCFEDNEAAPSSMPGSMEKYAELVIETAYKFAEFSSGQREVKAVKAIRGEE